MWYGRHDVKNPESPVRSGAAGYIDPSDGFCTGHPFKWAFLKCSPNIRETPFFHGRAACRLPSLSMRPRAAYDPFRAKVSLKSRLPILFGQERSITRSGPTPASAGRDVCVAGDPWASPVFEFWYASRQGRCDSKIRWISLASYAFYQALKRSRIIINFIDYSAHNLSRHSAGRLRQIFSVDYLFHGPKFHVFSSASGFGRPTVSSLRCEIIL